MAFIMDTTTNIKPRKTKTGTISASETGIITSKRASPKSEKTNFVIPNPRLTKNLNNTKKIKMINNNSNIIYLPFSIINIIFTNRLSYK